MLSLLNNIAVQMRTVRLITAILFLSLSSSIQADEYELSHQTAYPAVRSSGGEYRLTAIAGPSDMQSVSGGGYELMISIEAGRPIRYVDLISFADFANQWLSANPSSIADLNKDEVVDLSDLCMLAEEWLNLSPPDWYLK